MKDQSIQSNMRLIGAFLMAAGLVAMLLLVGALDPVRAEPAASNLQTDTITTSLTAQDLQKIDPELIREFNAKGQADFFIWM